MPPALPIALGLLFAALLYLRGWNHLRNAIPAIFRCGAPPRFAEGCSASGSPPLSARGVGRATALRPHGAAPSADDRGSAFDFAGLSCSSASARFTEIRDARRIGAASAFPLVQRFGHFLANPVFCWFAATAVLIGWHVPAAFAMGLSSESWHRVEHASFLAAGLIFWWPVIPSWPSVSQPRWPTVLYLFLATLPCDALSAFLAFCDRVVYPAYLACSASSRICPLFKTRSVAGALMWVCVTFAYLVPAVAITTRLLSTRDVYAMPLARLISASRDRTD